MLCAQPIESIMSHPFSLNTIGRGWFYRSTQLFGAAVSVLGWSVCCFSVIGRLTVTIYKSNENKGQKQEFDYNFGIYVK